MSSITLQPSSNPVVEASNTVKGIAKFDATDFTVTSGDVAIAAGVTITTPVISGGMDIGLAADDNIVIDGNTIARTITSGAVRHLHKAGISGTRATNYVIDANNFDDTHAVNVEFVATGTSPGDQNHLYDIHVNTANSTGGEVQGFAMAKVGAGTTTCTLAEAYPGVNVIRHRSGTETDIGQAWIYNGAYADITISLTIGGSDIQLFVANGDIVYIGNAVKFDSLSVILTTVASGAGIKPTFEYWSGAAWTAFGPTDGTNGFRTNGTIAWDILLSGWATINVNGATKFYIRITRTQNVLTTPPTEDYIRYVASVDYAWDSDGDVAIRTLDVNSSQANTVKIATIANTAGDIDIFRVDATPEGSITASIGDIAVGNDGVEGQIWVKQTGNGTNTGWVQIGVKRYAQFHIHENATVTPINTVSVPHAVQGVGSVLVAPTNGFTFSSGSTGAITNTANNGGILRITDVGHGLSTGDIVTITGLATAAQNNITQITRIGNDTFDCDDIAFATAGETGNWYKGDALIANTGADGIYSLSFNGFGISSGVNKVFEFELAQNSTLIEVLESRRFFATSSDYGSFSAQGMVTVTAGDIISFIIIGITDTTDFTITHLNVSLHSI